MLYSPFEYVSEQSAEFYDTLKPLNYMLKALFMPQLMYMYVAFPEEDLYY